MARSQIVHRGRREKNAGICRGGTGMKKERGEHPNDQSEECSRLEHQIKTVETKNTHRSKTQYTIRHGQHRGRPANRKRRGKKTHDWRASSQACPSVHLRTAKQGARGRYDA